MTGGQGVPRDTPSTGMTPAAFREFYSSRERGDVEKNITAAIQGFTWENRPKGTRQCSKCFLWFPVAAFRPNPRLKSGLSSWCGSCHVLAQRRWRAAHPEYDAAYNASRRQGPFALTCADCGKPFEGARRRMVRCPDCQQALRKGWKR